MNNKNSVNFKRQSLAVAISCVYMTIALAPVVYASDTEIYTDSTKNTTIAPNLMMVFDTSGSMSDCIDSNESCTSASTLYKQRMRVLKNPCIKFCVVTVSLYRLFPRCQATLKWV